MNGLETEFDNVTFVVLNARDGDVGEAAFTLLNLPGHPSFVLFNANGEERFRAFGIVEADRLREALAEM